ncbi:hypothetical protein RN001_013999 [Aquatica leii]|uniref:DUF7869 domain-containing protein n=1 Tax=Aquatica leii TaxID=1421715 RepID=A0AAN7PRA4_9COLE|nr:hypothetical protein RN001_013999 [Aquatica leii]
MSDTDDRVAKSSDSDSSESEVTLHDEDATDDSDEDNYSDFNHERNINGKLITLCQSAFSAVHGIKRSKLRRKIQKNNAKPQYSRSDNKLRKKANMYMFAEHFARKGPNEVITCLQYYITQNKKPEQRILQLFCDNCYNQNKNRFLFVFLDQLCANNIFETIEIWYPPIPGHSMMPVDQDFAVIEKQRLKRDNVDNPEVYVNLIKECKQKTPFDVVFVQHSLRSNGCLEESDRTIKVKHYKLWLDSHIKGTVPGISKARRVKFSLNEQPQLSASYYGPMEPLNLYTVGHSRKLCCEPNLATTNIMTCK